MNKRFSENAWNDYLIYHGLVKMNYILKFVYGIVVKSIYKIKILRFIVNVMKLIMKWGIFVSIFTNSLQSFIIKM